MWEGRQEEEEYLGFGFDIFVLHPGLEGEEVRVSLIYSSHEKYWKENW